MELSGVKRASALALSIAIGAAVLLRSSGQLAAMSLYATSTKRDVLERASTFDPGSYRIHVRLAQLHVSRGDCKRARPHAQAARALFPSSAPARRLVNACG